MVQFETHCHSLVRITLFEGYRARRGCTKAVQLLFFWDCSGGSIFYVNNYKFFFVFSSHGSGKASIFHFFFHIFGWFLHFSFPFWTWNPAQKAQNLILKRVWRRIAQSAEENFWQNSGSKGDFSNLMFFWVIFLLFFLHSCSFFDIFIYLYILIFFYISLFSLLHK